MIGEQYARIFGKVKRGPLCAFMVLWCFKEKGYSVHFERAEGWKCQGCDAMTVEFPESAA